MANNIEIKELLDAGVHFGHLTRKWNPNMAPYIYMERNGIHVINLYKTAAKIEEATEALKKIVASGKKVLFVATKKQAKDVVAEKAQRQSRLTKQRTTGSRSITAPFTATSAKTKTTAALCGNTSEYAANPTANATAAHGPEAKCPTASA